MFILNTESGIPIYRQLIEQVRRMIASGQLQVGAELPSVRELALAHGVNPMTISKAYAQLEVEGLLSRQRGKPMRVAEPNAQATSEDARIAQLNTQLDELILAAKQLQLSPQVVLAALKHKLGNERKKE